MSAAQIRSLNIKTRSLTRMGKEYAFYKVEEKERINAYNKALENKEEPADVKFKLSMWEESKATILQSVRMWHKAFNDLNAAVTANENNAAVNTSKDFVAAKELLSSVEPPVEQI